MTEESSRAGTTLGPYRLDALIGRGGMGEVYRAYDTVKDRTVALKLLSPQLVDNQEFRGRFMTESRTAARLSEPHIIPIHDFGEIDGLLFIDMRMVDGQDLRSILKRGPIPPGRAVNIVSQIANALDAAHRSGLVHRDVKPDNILIDENDFAYLVDFGIAHGIGDTSMTMAGTALGSLAYMAPERFGDQQAGPASDTYSLACVFFEALSGRQPFGGATTEALITAHLTKAPPTTGLAFDPVIAHGMGKDPTARYGSTKEFARAIGRALATMPQSAQNTAAIGRPPAAAPRPTPTTPPPVVRPTYPAAGVAASTPPQSGAPTPSGPQAHSHTSGPQGPGRPGYGPQGPSGPQSTGAGFGSGPHTRSGPTGAGPGGNGPGSTGFGGGYGFASAPVPPPPVSPSPATPRSSGGGNGRKIAIVAAAALLVIVVGAIGIVVALNAGGGGSGPSPAVTSSVAPVAMTTCDYRTDTDGKGPTSPKPPSRQPSSGTTQVELDTNQGNIAMALNSSIAPCNVGGVVSLAKNGYYDNTTCHRLSSDGSFLICGDPTGTQAGGPGWASPDELPKNLPATGRSDDKGRSIVTYPRGSVLMVNTDPVNRTNAGDGTGAAMLIFMIKPNTSVPYFSMVGTVDDASLAVLDRVAAGGATPDKPGADYGRPQTSVVISTATVK